MRINLHFLIIISCLTGISSGYTFAQIPIDSVKNIIREQIVSRIDNKVAVGTVVAFLDNGKEDYFVYGFTNTTARQPISKKSVFEIGSITKTFTSLLLADLVEKGKVKLDDPVQTYLPDSVKMPSFNNQNITLADLATHTSGLPRMPDNFNPGDPTDPYADYGPKELYAFLKTYQLKRAVGVYAYSNVGVGLLGHILTLVAGKSYEQLVKDVICKPLNMHATSTLNTSPFLTTGHSGIRPVAHWDFDALGGAGAIRSNAEDMMQYVKAELGLVASPLKQAIQLTQQPLHEVGKNMKIGLGWHILSANNDDIVWHNGGTGGYRTFAGFSKKTNKAIIILNNSGQSPDDLGMYFFNPMAKITPVKKAIVVSKQILQSYVGVYEIKPGDEFDVKVAGEQLLIKLTGQDYLDAYPESETKFFYRVVDASVAFFKNEKGEVDKLVLYQNGREISARRK